MLTVKAWVKLTPFYILKEDGFKIRNEDRPASSGPKVSLHSVRKHRMLPANCLALKRNIT